MIDLREQDRTGICDIAQSIFPTGVEIWAYGSRVKGTNHDTSDLDLVVHFPDGQAAAMSAKQLTQFRETLRDSNIPIIVQVLAWHGIPDTFKDNIAQCYQVLWSSKQ